MSAISPANSLQIEIARPAQGWFHRALAFGKRLTSDTLLQNSVLSVFDQAIVSGTSFATSIILGRFCGRSELGVYCLALAVVLFIRGIQEQLVIAPYMIYCGRRQGTAAASYAGSSLLHHLLLTGIASVGLVAVALVGFSTSLDQTLLWTLVAAAPLLLARDFLRQMCFAQLELRTALVLDATTATIQLGGLLILGWLGWLSVATTLLLMAGSCGLAAVGWIVGKRRSMTLRVSAAVADWQHNWPFAKWALASHLLACSTPLIMPWVVALTRGEAATGTLGACSTLVGLSNMFMMGLANFLSPKAAHAFASGGLKELTAILRKTAALFVVTLGAASLAGFLIGDQVAAFVYGPSFAGTGLIVGVLATSILANSLGVTCGNGLWAMERPNASFRADVISLVVTIISTAILIPLFGTLGAALAMLTGTSCDAFVRYLALRVVMREVQLQEARA